MVGNSSIVNICLLEDQYLRFTNISKFAAYETASITSSLDSFTGRFSKTDVNITFMPNHEVSAKFPFTMAELSQWDVIVFSDAPADSFLPRKLWVVKKY